MSTHFAKDIADLADKVANDGQVREGDRIKVRSRRSGWQDGYVSAVEFKPRARRFPYVVKVVTDGGGDLTGKVESNRYDSIPWLEFVSKGGGGSKAIQDSRQRGLDRAQSKEDIAQAGREKLRELNLQPGDVIRFKYTNGVSIEVVVDTNYKTGKVGIDRFKGDAIGKQKYLDDIRRMNDFAETMDYLYGLRSRRKSDRSTRWLHAQNIIEVVSRAPR